MDDDQVLLRCLDCKHQWSILCPTVMENGEKITKIGMFDDLYPICESQGEIANTLEKEQQAG